MFGRKKSDPPNVARSTTTKTFRELLLDDADERTLALTQLFETFTDVEKGAIVVSLQNRLPRPPAQSDVRGLLQTGMISRATAIQMLGGVDTPGDLYAQQQAVLQDQFRQVQAQLAAQAQAAFAATIPSGQTPYPNISGYQLAQLQQESYARYASSLFVSASQSPSWAVGSVMFLSGQSGPVIDGTWVDAAGEVVQEPVIEVEAPPPPEPWERASKIKDIAGMAPSDDELLIPGSRVA